MSFILESENFIDGFEVKSFKHEISSHDTKIVKIGIIQSSVNFSTNEEWSQEKVFKEVEKMIKIAADSQVNILALPELFAIPYPFYAPEEFPWKNYAESEKGRTFEFLSKLSKAHNMIIIGSILETSNDEIFNTCLVISNHGELIGKYRKHHIPPIEAEHLSTANFDCPTFETDFGKIGILICYERHFPLKWMTLAMKGAQIIFNPSSEDENSLSERMWLVEGLNAAVSNGIFTVNVNRVGCENFSENCFKYFGSSYIASPQGFITTPLSRENQGILISSVDINAIKEVKTKFSFHKNLQLKSYTEELSRLSHEVD